MISGPVCSVPWEDENRRVSFTSSGSRSRLSSSALSVQSLIWERGRWRTVVVISGYPTSVGAGRRRSRGLVRYAMVLVLLGLRFRAGGPASVRPRRLSLLVHRGQCRFNRVRKRLKRCDQHSRAVASGRAALPARQRVSALFCLCCWGVSRLGISELSGDRRALSLMLVERTFSVEFLLRRRNSCLVA